MAQAMSMAVNVGRGVAQAAAALLLMSQGIPPAESLMTVMQATNAAEYGRVAIGARLAKHHGGHGLE